MDEVKEAVERIKKIEVLRQSEKYETEKMRIESLDLEYHKKLYNGLALLFNSKRDKLEETNVKYKQLHQNYVQITNELNKTIVTINSNPKAYPEIPEVKKVVDSKADELKAKIEEVKNTNNELAERINLMKEKYINVSKTLHDANFQIFGTYYDNILHNQRRKRSLSVCDLLKLTNKEIDTIQYLDLISHSDETNRNLLQIHQERKLQIKYSQPPPQKAALSATKENGGLANIIHSPMKSSAIPGITPSCIKTNLFNEERIKSPQRNVWGYIPVKKAESNKWLDIVSKSYHVKEGNQLESVVLKPYGPWSVYMKDALTYIGYDSVLGTVVLSICEIKPNSCYPPEYLQARGEILCTFKSKKGEHRTVLDKFLVMKENEFNIQLISSLLEPSASNIKYKVIEHSGRVPLLWKFDEINTPTTFEVAVRYINTESVVNIVEDCLYPTSFDKFLTTFSAAMKVNEESSFQQLTNQLSCTKHYFYCQNDWCEIAYFVSPLMGKEDRVMVLENSIVSLLFVEGNQPLQLDNISTNEIVIIVTPDLNGYSVRVAQKGNDCFVETPLPQSDWVIPGYQMKGFMTSLVVDCYKCYRNWTQAVRHFTKQREKVLMTIKKLK